MSRPVIRVQGLKALLVLIASVVVVGALALEGTAATTTQTLDSVADAYVSQAKPNTNYGAAKDLQVASSPDVRSYLRFDVATLSGKIEKATLRVLTKNASSVGVQVRGVADNGWDERTISYATAPAPSQAVAATSGRFAKGVWVDLDVTSLVSGKGPVSFAITSPSTAAVSLASREQSAAAAPKLVVITTAPEPPVDVVGPVLSGVAQAGEVLGAERGVWSGSEPIEFAYEWRRCDADGLGCVVIAGATGASYRLVGADVGRRVRVAVTATNVAGSATAVSGPSGVVAAAPEPPVIAAAGDIACSPSSPLFNGGLGVAHACRQRATSDLLVGRGLSAVLPLGDTQYVCGGYASFVQSYDPSWGRVKEISRPVIGNHEYETIGDDCDETGSASGYFTYFGPAAGDPDKGYYSYDLDGWHLIALNSNCHKIGGCDVGSPQHQWLRQDLASSPAACTLAYWHHPRFTSGVFFRPGISSVKPLFATLHQYGADVVLAGHDHRYERFAPQDPDGGLDLATGIRSFVVGTGGQEHHRSGDPVPNSEFGIDTAFGVLELTLRPGAYDWRFRADSGSVMDSGADSCDGTAPDTVAPSTPADLVADAPSAGRVDLRWSASSDDVGVIAYEIYRNGALLRTTATPALHYVDLSVQPGADYDYVVRARDAAGNVSEASGVVSVRVPVWTGYDAVVDADAPVAHFKLGDPAIGPYVDRAGGHNGTPRAMTRIAGGLVGNGDDGAALFNGSGSSISTAPAAGLNTGDTFTLEAWIKRNAVSSAAAQAIMSKRDGSWLMQINTNNRLTLRRSGVGDVGGSTVTITDTSGWHHVAITKAGPSVKWYIDGVDVSPATYTNQTMVDNTAGLFIGESGAAYFNGGIDEAAVYRTALSPDRIRAHYESGI